MSSIDSTDRLKESFRNFRDYPMNLVDSKSSHTSDVELRQTLEEARNVEFSVVPRPIDFVEMWDGDQDPQEIKVTDLAKHTSSNRKDPKSRFIFIRSGSKFGCSKEQLCQILTYHQVPPSFLDLVFTFRQRVGTGSLYGQEDTLLEAQNKRLEIRSLGRSGSILQHWFSLQTVEGPESNDEKPWLIRQAAVYHSFDIVTGRAVYIIAADDETLSERVRGMLLFRTSLFTGSQADGPVPTTIATSFGATLSTHLEHFRWCEESWRDYAQHAFQYVTEIDPKPVPTTSDRGPFPLPHSRSEPRDPACEKLRHLGISIDRLEEGLLAIKQNDLVLDSIVRHYKDLLSMPEVLNAMNGESCADIARFFEQTSTIKMNLRCNQLRIETVKRITQDRRDLMKACLSFQNMETKMTRVRTSEWIPQETSQMKIITLVTLIFLPGTFVATLMSSPSSPCPPQTQPPASWSTPASQDTFDNWIFILSLPAGITAFVIGALFVLRRMGNGSKVFPWFTSGKGGNLTDSIAEGHHQRDELEKDQFELPLSTSRYMD
ncbi:hypothetical protein QBC37DRAFT_422882 [Rhypophila decipiens]|uniref:CorA-like transporter domain-containing protein n=1 Tax=Rhypophila decipiens TaxID=261697 RepID=A0AAN6YCL0_9PEZI|nr:hypothetical protein QBC37DRAFT_422882 [Rhypophila decipiens]